MHGVIIARTHSTKHHDRIAETDARTLKEAEGNATFVPRAIRSSRVAVFPIKSRNPLEAIISDEYYKSGFSRCQYALLSQLQSLTVGHGNFGALSSANRRARLIREMSREKVPAKTMYAVYVPTLFLSVSDLMNACNTGQ